MNELKQLFISKFYDVLLLNDNLEKKFTEILVDITKSNYGYFNHVVTIDGKLYNKGSCLIDRKNQLDKAEIDSFDGMLFPLAEEMKNKPWSQNWFKKKITCFDMSDRKERICPIQNFEYYCNIPLMYNDEVVGCIALSGNSKYDKDTIDTLKEICKIISNQLWKHKYSYDKIIKQKNYLYDFFLSIPFI